MSDDNITVREDKLLHLREDLGIDPFPARCMTSMPISEIRESGETEESVVVSGRLTGKREHGKTVFADLRDGTGSIQLYLSRKILSDREYNPLGNE